jgi:hypothetical protein
MMIKYAKSAHLIIIILLPAHISTLVMRLHLLKQHHAVKVPGSSCIQVLDDGSM